MLSFSTIVMMAVCTALAALLTLSRIRGFMFVLKYAVIVDVVFTIALVFMFSGTMSGMLVAVLAGLALSLILTGCRWIARQAQGVKARNDTEFDRNGEWVYNQAPYI